MKIPKNDEDRLERDIHRQLDKINHLILHGKARNLNDLWCKLDGWLYDNEKEDY